MNALALCWAFRKRAFSVSGSFRQLLSDLIKYMHNSNRQLYQVTLSGETLLECKFYVIGFVPADVVHLKREVWFKKLDSSITTLLTAVISTEYESNILCSKNTSCSHNLLLYYESSPRYEDCFAALELSVQNLRVRASDMHKV